MKTKNILKIAVIIIALAGLGLSGCKKDRKTSGTDSTSLQQLAKDENQVSSASDDAMNDANAVLSGNGAKSTENLPCNATIDSTTVINDTITYHITYNGPNCFNTIIRNGVVEIKRKQLQHWSDPMAAVMVKFINLSITHVVSGKHLVLNGTKTYQNVTGGLMIDLGAGMTSIVHKVWGSLDATFDDGSTRVWQIARQKTFTGTLAHLIMAVDGFGAAGTYTNLGCWGLNRQGENFYSQITQSIVFKKDCQWHPVSGILIHEIPSDSKSATITYGYDDNNIPVTNGNCPTRYKVDWQKNNNSGTIFFELP